MPTMATRSLMPLLAMRVSFGSGIAPPAVTMPPRRESEASPVEGHHLEGCELDAVEAAHVDHRPGGARLVAAERERRAAAGRTEVMPDPAAPEGVGRQLGLGRGQAQLVARPHPEKVAALRADRAVALHDLVELAVDLERDPPAVTSALVGHGHGCEPCPPVDRRGRCAIRLLS